MLWNEVKVVNQRHLFVEECLAKKLDMTELCLKYGISRPTGYKWLDRYKKDGIAGLVDMSRAPHIQGRSINDNIVSMIINIRCKYPAWGPNKIKAWLDLNYNNIEWPCSGSIGNILTQNGLTVARKYRRHVAAKTVPFANCTDSNDTWCVDFKGWWLTKDNAKYEPLTLSDAVSRFILRATNLKRNDTEHVWGIFDSAFREYGQPFFMRSDNGSPFASLGVGRLSPLAIKLIKSGVTPEWIDPGKPQQNGRHERMHRTMKNEVAQTPADNIIMQEMDILEFRQYYNFERPHEAIGQVTPASIYTPSNRIWNGQFNSPEYSSELLIRTVCKAGYIKWKGEKIYMSRALQYEPIGIEEINNDMWVLYYGLIILGYINQKNEFHRPENYRRKKFII